MITSVFPHVPIMHNYVNVAVLSSLPSSDSLSLFSLHWLLVVSCSLHYAWVPGNSNNHCTMYALRPVTTHICPKHTTLGYVEHFHTNVEARFVICPCSAINTVPGEDGHRARNGRAEITWAALEALS